MTSLEYLKKEALRIAGIPLLEVELDDSKFESEVVEPSLYEYFIIAPYEYMVQRTFNGRSTAQIDVPDIAAIITEWPSGAKAEFVGLTSFMYNEGLIPNSYSYLGLEPDISNLYGETLDDMQVAITTLQMNKTIGDQLMGDAHFEFDVILQKLKVFVPATGKLGIGFGYRLNKVKYVKQSHMITFSKMVTRKFLELLISARSSVILSSDVSLDMNPLQQKLDQINETYEMDLQAISTPVVMFG